MFPLLTPCSDLGFRRGLLFGGLLFGFGFQFRLGRPDLLDPALAPRQLLRQLVAATPLAILRILGRIHILGLLEQRLDLRFQPRLGLSHARVTHRLMLARVGLDLGSIDRHMAQLHQTGLFAQQQGLREQPRKRLQMTLAKLRKCIVVRMRVRRKITERHILIGPSLDLA